MDPMTKPLSPIARRIAIAIWIVVVVQFGLLGAGLALPLGAVGNVIGFLVVICCPVAITLYRAYRIHRR